jgi:ATP-binding cassette, subfamily D (ALD), member 3
LAGYTTLVTDLRKVLDDLEKRKKRLRVLSLEQFVSASLSEITKQKGEIIPAENIKFDAVPVYTPNGDLLVQDLSFEIGAGMNCIVTGPNGCGKSSLFRILGSLWPIFGGKLYRPSLDKMFYIPQRPYLPPGNLRDQIIYPHTKLQMLRKRGKDEDIKEILKAVRLEYLIEREGGFDAINDWNDVLSGTEKKLLSSS